ncbi:LPXTG cell wall anchor domain-containing protein [Streptomyces sp. NPDC060184]|uniref:LPXTG cell wall anchor domain-containing protein n=1 Tax=Streptomyces sp. NPDC060184 TaxID=3347064 RepID=UPI003661CC43
MPSHFLRRSRSAAAVLGLAVALPLCGAGSAHAHDAHSCDRIGVEYTSDRGQHWFSSGVIAGDAPATRVDVRLKGEPAAGCQYVLSLASYSTEGPNWASSGTQTFLGRDSVVLTKDLAQTVLDVSAFTPECFGQIDLYSGDRAYDGTDAPVPHYPDSQIGSHLIAHWNGGAACTPAPPVTPTPDAPTTPPAATPTPGPTTPVADTPSPSSTPTTTTPAPAPSETPAESTPTPAASTTPPAAATPDEPPTDSTVPGTLASTGSDSTTTLVTTLAATVLVAVGVGLYVFTRRRRQGLVD